MAWRTFVVFASLLATLAGAGPSFAGPFAPAPAFRERPVSTPAQASLLNDYRGQLKRAMDAEQAGDWAGAEQALDQAIRLGGRLRITARELAGLETDKAGVLMDQGRYDDAETLLKQALSALDARDRRGAVYTTEAYFKLGQLYMREARWKEAVEMLSRAIETSPRGDTRDELARLEIEDALAIAYVNSGRADLAVPFFNEDSNSIAGIPRNSPKRSPASRTISPSSTRRAFRQAETRTHSTTPWPNSTRLIRSTRSSSAWPTSGRSSRSPIAACCSGSRDGTRRRRRC